MGGGDDSHDKHIHSHHEGSSDKGASSADLFNKEHEEEEAGNDLDQAKEAAEKESILASSDSIEDLG